MADSCHLPPSLSAFYLVENFTFMTKLCQEKELVMLHQYSVIL
jgi:hypothetical protein